MTSQVSTLNNSLLVKHLTVPGLTSNSKLPPYFFKTKKTWAKYIIQIVGELKSELKALWPSTTKHYSPKQSCKGSKMNRCTCEEWTDQSG